jgi:iron complex outermembrane recepter protein
MFFAEPINPPTDVVIVTAASRKDKITQGVVVINRDHALIHSLSGGIGETLAGHSGIRSSFYGTNASRPIIRGLGEDRIRLLNNGLLGIDASTISPDHAPAIDGLEAQSIEVLKGASALMYGANAVGGVVNIIDNRLVNTMPAKPKTLEAFVGGASVDNSRAIAIKLGQTYGDFVFGIEGVNRKSGDYKIPAYAQSEELRAQTLDETQDKIPNSHGDFTAFGANAAYIGKNFNIALSARHQDSNYGIPNEEAHIDMEQDKLDFAANLKLGKLIENISLSGSFGDYTHGEIEDSGEIGTVFNMQGHEIRLDARHKVIKGFDGLFGLQTSDRDFEANGEEAFIKPGNQKNIGIFYIENFERGKFNSQIGLRSENTKYSGQVGDVDFNSQSASLNFGYKPIANLNLGAMVAITERIPTETELFADGPHAATQSYEKGNANLKLETAKSAEFSIRYRPSNKNFEFNLWQADFDNFINFANSGAIEDDLPLYEVVQKDAKLQGFEIQYEQYLGHAYNADFNLDLGIDYVRGKYDDATNIARMPPMAFNSAINANFDQFSARFEYQHLNAQNKLAQFETKTQSADIFNISTTYRSKTIEHLEYRLLLSNIGNAQIREHTSVLKDYLPKPGRSLRFGLHYQY